MRRAIAEARPTAVFLPMGLANPDHVLTHDAGLLARAALAAAGCARARYGRCGAITSCASDSTPTCPSSTGGWTAAAWVGTLILGR